MLNYTFKVSGYVSPNYPKVINLLLIFDE